MRGLVRDRTVVRCFAEIRSNLKSEGIQMKNTKSAVLHEPHHATSHRYQIYRQANKGSHYSHGSMIDSPEEADRLSQITTTRCAGH